MGFKLVGRVGLFSHDRRHPGLDFLEPHEADPVERFIEREIVGRQGALFVVLIDEPPSARLEPVHDRIPVDAEFVRILGHENPP